MKHYGDITKLNGHTLPPVDVITGGSPCQDLSVAGKRAGLEGERSGLFMEQIRIVKEMREEDEKRGRTAEFIRPRFMVWENVPGAFSSNGGQDFKAVLEETAKVIQKDAFIPEPPGGKWSPAGCVMGKGWSIAWRVHDAQFWGVPQRRKRICLIADFGGLSAPEILFERKGLSGDSAESGETRKGITENAERSIGAAGGRLNPWDVQSKSVYGENAVINSLCSGTTEGMNIQPCVCYGISSYESNAMKSENPNSGIYEADTSRTLDLNGENPACNQGGMAVVESAGFDGNQGAKAGSIGYGEEMAGTLEASKVKCVLCLNDQSGVEQPAVFDGSRRHDYKEFKNVSETVQAQYGTGGNNQPLVVCHKTSHPADDQPVLIEMTSTKNTIVDSGISPTLTSRMGTGGNQVNAVCLNDQGGSVMAVSENKVATLRAENHGHIPAVMMAEEGKETKCSTFCMDVGFFQTEEEKSGALLARQYKDPPIVTDKIQKTVGSLMASGYSKNGTQEAANDMYVVQSNWDGSQVAPTLTSNNAGGGQRMPDKDNFNAVLTYGHEGTQVAKNPGAVCQSIVRRLTPLECERLQGFPDDWTLIGTPEEVEVKDFEIQYDEDGNETGKRLIGTHKETEYFYIDENGKKKKCSDSARYKALGNSIAIPFWFYVLRRISAQYERPATLGSLFDGIGGFPLCWEKCNGKGTAIWASEIEDFCIAVTKERFPEK